MEKKLTLGMPVHCPEGEVGRLEKIIAEAETREPAYLIVRRGLVARRDIVVPVSLVRELTPQGIMLDTTLEALKTFPEYKTIVEKSPKAAPDPTLLEPLVPPLLKAWEKQGPVKIRQRTVPEYMTDITQGMTVYDHAGAKLGAVQGVMVDEKSRQANHLLVHRLGTPQEEQRLVPVDLVDYVIRSDLYLRITKDQVQGLTLYKLSETKEA